MSDLLTHAEYQAIAQDMNLACNAFIDGKFQAARSRKTFASVNPATGKVIAKIAACDAKDVNFAVKKPAKPLTMAVGADSTRASARRY